MLDDRYTLAHKLYPYARSADQDAGQAVHHPVIIIGGGPVGMAAALDLGLQGVPVLVLDDHEGVGEGSRAICFAKRTLEICDRLGCGAPMVEKGVVWNLGKVFHGDEKVFEFNLLPEGGHRMPAFINLQQPYFEKHLVERMRAAQAQGAPIEIRGKNRVEALDIRDDGARLDITTPEGGYTLTADWVLACDGAGSPTRKALGLGFEGQVFKDSFLIADVRMTAEFPTERWFWFDPPFRDAGASALLHKQPDDIWRIDFQIGWNADRETELQEDRIRARIDAMLGDGVEYELVWTSIYTFQCRRMSSFRRGRVLFVGDSAHQVSPFGARGCNGGIQDADNLCWKLAAVLQGRAPETLLETYDTERGAASDENIRNSTRSTDFITPKSEMSRVFRDAVLHLARRHDFARPFVNSGRLSQPCIYDGSVLNGEDALPGAPPHSRPGAPAPDAPLEGGFLLDRLGGAFTLLVLGCPPPEGVDMPILHIDAPGPDLSARYLGNAERGLYLIRPDQHVVARWAEADAAQIAAARDRALGKAAS
ncbi:3-(3-hydroxy-phenyl)propionate/3-hydroxycinnamic acid hydroxylase [Roseivivax sp. THAF40]|uniref:FAD-dependent oxidoreductase n=1 Tax=unclassified Roseivivax TaxID=2639302 RepID=UPI001267AFCC|nr:MULTISPECIES: FAD-dependent oxidoreductase [unclassified Roseivivax]QFS82845.1 3-(3-hydroxy-phenyl)propionate/3-hydroxycinnamic acid hydroxylase [Roseivivax sp. THAF197b]QFT46614.1 3-(3-hydroxy-phenyl)propionate/3-hydroxycinnamic acid hydroxylase [Roseivivax sp. THAF40]